MPALADTPSERRLALIVASSEYRDPTLQRLRAPGRDAEALAEVLGDPAIGAFDLRTLLNLPSNELLCGIAEFCADSRPTDLLLFYFSCHGLLDDRGQLYYGTVNTERRLLTATSVSARWLNDQLEDCPARRQILILDCCHSGAFDRGAKGDGSLALRERFGSRGRVVLTASRATEYSFEGDQVPGQGVSSHFTAALVHGLRTGEADRDEDGFITVNELYQYVFDRTRAYEARQTPALWTDGAEGDILMARSPRGKVITPVAPPEELQATLARVAVHAESGQASEQVRTEVEERAHRLAQDQRPRDAERKAHREATTQRERNADQEARRKVDNPTRTRRRWPERISSHLWAPILTVAMGIAGVVAVSITDRTPTPPIMGHLPDELRARCRADADNSATCTLADGMLVLFQVFDTPEEAHADVVNGNEPAPDGRPCPPDVPPSETAVVCRYSVGSENGVAMFGHTVKAPERFYLSRWTSDAEPRLRGEMSTSDANPEDWATLQADWRRLAGMR